MESKNKHTLIKSNIIRAYLNSAENIISDISEISNYNDQPKFYEFCTSHNPLVNNIQLYASGISEAKSDSINKAIMETIERYCWTNQDNHGCTLDTYEAMVKKKYAVLPLQDYVSVSRAQQHDKKYAAFRVTGNSEVYWTTCRDLMTNKEVFVPAELIYFLPKSKQKMKLLLPNSTGKAAGFSVEDALQRALYEIVERDAYAIWFYNMLPMRRLAITHKLPKEIINAIQYCRRYQYEPHLYKLTIDIPIPVYGCYLVDKTRKNKFFTVGLKCNTDNEKALMGAILESIQPLSSIRDYLAILDKRSRNNQYSYSNNPILRKINKVKYVLPGEEKHAQVEWKEEKEKLNMGEIKELLQSRGIQVMWRRLSDEKLERLGIYVVGVTSPQLVPLSLHAEYQYFGKNRIFNVPVSEKLVNRPRLEEDLSTFPHPFI